MSSKPFSVTEKARIHTSLRQPVASIVSKESQSPWGPDMHIELQYMYTMFATIHSQNLAKHWSLLYLTLEFKLLNKIKGSKRRIETAPFFLRSIPSIPGGCKLRSRKGQSDWSWVKTPTSKQFVNNCEQIDRILQDLNHPRFTTLPCPSLLQVTMVDQQFVSGIPWDKYHQPSYSQNCGRYKVKLIERKCVCLSLCFIWEIWVVVRKCYLHHLSRKLLKVWLAIKLSLC